MKPSSTIRARSLAPSRHNEIIKRVSTSGVVVVSELAEFFGVSRETVRRDLKQLADRGQLDIVHGGASRRESNEPAYEQRIAENAAGKAAIAGAAADLVTDDMVVLLDSGTTTLAIAHALAQKRNLTICTSSLAIAQLTCRIAGTRVYMLGGEVNPQEEATSGTDTLEAVSHFRVDIAFIGAGGLSPDGEVTDFTRIGAEQRARMVRSASRAYFVIDHTKFNRLTPLRISNFQSATGIITDRRAAPPIVEALARRGLELILPL